MLVNNLSLQVWASRLVGELSNRENSDTFGHGECVILRDSRNLLARLFPL